MDQGNQCSAERAQGHQNEVEPASGGERRGGFRGAARQEAPEQVAYGPAFVEIDDRDAEKELAELEWGER